MRAVNDIAGTFIIAHWSGSFRVTSGAGGAADQWQGHEVQGALFTLRHGFFHHHSAVVEPIERWFRAASGGGLSLLSGAFSPRSAGAFGTSPSVAAWDRTRMQAWDAFEAAVNSGALGLARVVHQAVFVTPVEAPQAPKLESPRQEEPTHFEATIVDEIGEPIAGLEMVLSCEGRDCDLVTNGAGQVRQEGVTASRASLRVKNTQQLRDIVSPRWDTPRQGTFPRAKNLLSAELAPGMGSFPLAAKEEHLIVITPVTAALNVEWWDGRGKHRHVECSYQVTGPRSFSGKTDQNGQLLHLDVPLGEYTLKITVEYFKGRSYSQTLSFEEKVTLIRGSGLQVRRVGPTPEVAFRRTRGYLFDLNKSFLMPRAAKQLLELPNWWQDRAPSQLLVVGHTDVTGKQGVNDVLSQARADVVKAFLEQDVDAWLAFYDEQGATKWGSREDRLMIRSLPDFAQSAAGAKGAGSRTAVDVNERPQAPASAGGLQANGATAWSPGVAANGAAETIVEWFQRTRGLDIDDVAGAATRRALISEYMGVGSVTLRETQGYPASIATLGEGEDYPLAETGLPLDVKVSSAGTSGGSTTSSGADARSAGADATGDPFDRRVELFFFDNDFGILPPVGDVGGPEYIEWRKRVEEESDVAVGKEVQEAKYLAVRNAQFRTGSAVMLPEGDAPSRDGKTPLTSVGILATALRYNEEHRYDDERPSHTMLIAGHSDSVGGDKDNDTLSEQRAQLVHAVLTGGAAGRSTFRDIADETGTVSDWKQILKWASVAFPCVEELVDEDAEDTGEPVEGDAETREVSGKGDAAESDTEPQDGALGTGFTDCDPGEIDDNDATGVDAVTAFQTAYNENYELLGGAGEISVDGEVGKQTWGAIYDLYQYNLAQELGETFEGLSELQGLVHLLPTSKPYVGFGESAPADGAYANDTDEQVNRRVEVLFFAYGHEPELAVLDDDPHVSELYHGEVFSRVEIPGRPGGAKAHWTVVVACPDGEDRSVILENESGTYRQQLAGTKLVFDGVPNDSFIRVLDAESMVPVARRLLLRSMVPVSKLETSTRPYTEWQPLALNFLDYPLEETTRGT
jgi:outer membrane protein OmpA-like peptidoglycan-associated protein